MSAVVGSLRAELSASIAKFTDDMGRAADSVGKFSKSFERAGDRLAKVGTAMSLAITAPLLLFAKHALTAASDAAELQSAFDYSFGAMKDEMNDWARSVGDALGRSTQQIQQQAFTFNQLFKSATTSGEASAELSKQFTTLANDLSSFFNVAERDALEKLRSGLVGEAEPLRAFGVFLSDAAVKQKALELGVGGASGELSEQQKILLRAAIIFDQTKDAQGDLARTADSASNRQRAFQAAMEELSVTVGQKLLPTFTPLVQKLTELAIAFTTLDPQTQQFAIGVAAAAAVAGPLLVAIGGLLRAFAALAPLLRGVALFARLVGAAFLLITSPITAVIAAGVALGTAVAGWIVGFENLWIAVQVTYQQIKQWLYDKLQPIFGWFTDQWEKLKSLFGGGASENVKAAEQTGTAAKNAADAVGQLGKSSVDFAAMLKQQLQGLSAAGQTFDKDKFLKSHKADVDQLRAAIDPAAAALKRYAEMAKVAEVAGLDMAASQKVLRAEALEAAGGLEAVEGKLQTLPPLLRQAAREAQAAKLAEDQKREAQAQDDKNKALAESLSLEHDLEYARDKRLADIEEARKSGLISEKVYQASVQDTWKDFEDGANKGNEALQRVDLVLDRMGQTLADLAFGTTSWKDALSQLGRQLFQIGIDDVLGDIKSGIKGLSGGKGGGSSIGSTLSGIGSFFSSVFSSFSGGFATGGTIPAGQWGIVGERGPEPVFAGGQDLEVMPNGMLAAGAMGGGFRPTINVYGVQNPDQFRSTETQIGRKTFRAWEQGQRGR